MPATQPPNTAQRMIELFTMRIRPCCWMALLLFVVGVDLDSPFYDQRSQRTRVGSWLAALETRTPTFASRPQTQVWFREGFRARPSGLGMSSSSTLRSGQIGRAHV